MAIKYLNSINLSKNELQNARIQNLASAPSSPVEGQIYYHSNTGEADLDNRMYFWDGSEWVDMSGGISSIIAGSGITVNSSSDGDDVTISVSSGAITNAMLANDSLTYVAGAGLTGGGEVALGGSATLNIGAGTGITVNGDDVQIKNAQNLTDDKIPLWDDTNGQLSDSIIKQSGTFLGINTNFPETELHVRGASNAQGNILIETDSVGGADADQASLHFRVSDNESAWKKFAIIAENTGDSSGRGALHFALNNEVSGASATIADADLTILSDGKVGIGTTNPTVDLHVDGAGYFSGNVEIDGNLTVDGTVTYVNSNTVEIGDNIILLNRDEAGTPSQDAGFEVERGTATNVSFLWSETNDYWTTGTQKLHVGNVPAVTAINASQILVSSSGVLSKFDASDISDLLVITTESGTASPSSAALTISAGEGINTTGSGSTVTITAETATASNKGVVELSTNNEAIAGTDATRAVTPQGLEAHYDSKKHAENVGNGTLKIIPITHNLGTRDVIVQLYDNSSYETVFTDIERTDANTVTLVFANAPALNAYRVLITSIA